jgi:hypothetical protein
MEFNNLNTLYGSDKTKSIYDQCFLKVNHKNPYINTTRNSKVNTQVQPLLLCTELPELLNADLNELLNVELDESPKLNTPIEVPSFLLNDPIFHESIEEYELSNESFLNSTSYDYSNSMVNPHIELKSTKRKSSNKEMPVVNKKTKINNNTSINHDTSVTKINNHTDVKKHNLSKGRARIIQLNNMTTEEKGSEKQFVLHRNKLASRQVRQKKKLYIEELREKLLEYKARDIQNQKIIEHLQQQKTKLLQNKI